MKTILLFTLSTLLPAGLVLAFEDRTPAVASSRIDGPGNDRVLDTFVDSGGSTYVVGTFESSALNLTRFEDTVGDGEDDSVEQVNQQSLNTAGGKDVFVAKYGANGSLEWARRAGGGGDDVGTGIAVDKDNNVFIAGYFSQTASFGGSQLTAEIQTLPDDEVGHLNTDAGFTMGNELFVAMLSPDGVWQWARKFEYTLRHERLEGGDELHKFNFVDDDGNIPDLSGWIEDRGQKWDAGRGYGWQDDRTDEGSDDGADDPLDEFIHTEDQWWRTTNDIEAGWYEIETRSFDPNDTDSSYHVYASDTSNQNSGVEMYFIENPQSGTKYTRTRFLEVVPASTPTIYILEGDRGDNNKLNYVVIRETELTASTAQALGELRIRSGSDDYAGKSLAIDSEGNLYLKGFFHGLITSDSSHPDWAIYMDPPTGGSIKLSSRLDGDLEKNSFILKFETGPVSDRSDPSSWNWGWMEMMTEDLNSETRIAEIIVDPADRVVAGGNWSGIMNGATAASPGSAFLTRHFASSGNRSGFLRVDGNSASRTTSPRIEAIVSDSQSQLYVLGNFHRRNQDIGGGLTSGARLDFSPGNSGQFSLTNFSKRNLFLAKADANSNWTWARAAPNLGQGLDPNSADIVGFDLAIDVGNDLYVTGILRDGPLVVDGQTLNPSTGSRNEPFLARVDVAGQAPVWETVVVPEARTAAHGGHIQSMPTGLLSWTVSSGISGFITENAADVRVGSRTGSANMAADSIVQGGSIVYQLDLELKPATELNTTGLIVGSEIPIPPNLITGGDIPRIKFFIGGSEITDWSNYIYYDSFNSRFLVVSPFLDGVIRFFNEDFTEELGPFPLSTRFPTDDDPPGSYQPHITGPNFAESKVELQPVG
ncbi:MAG: SBBP repeat-containing protein, partial [Verrucomicrobiota bacterium]